jgi:hypothetical protein
MYFFNNILFFIDKIVIRQYILSAVVVLFMICLVLALVFGVIVYRVIIITILSQSDSTRRYSGLLIYLKKILLGHLISLRK